MLYRKIGYEIQCVEKNDTMELLNEKNDKIGRNDVSNEQHFYLSKNIQTDGSRQGEGKKSDKMQTSPITQINDSVK